MSVSGFLALAVVLAGAACTNPPAPPLEAADSESVSTPQPQEDPHTTRRHAMVEQQIARRGVKDKRVLDALREVPRHLFVPDRIASEAYRDSPLRIGHGQTISQPYIVGFMTEMLQLKEGDKVLEIGTGSGYQAAILGEIAKEVYTIEIVEPLGTDAEQRLKKLGYDNVHVRIGDGYKGWEEHAPYDKIIVTCAPDHVPQPLIDQLRPGGRMSIPVGPTGGVQELVLMTKRADGTLRKDTVLPVRFVPLTRAKTETVQ